MTVLDDKLDALTSLVLGIDTGTNGALDTVQALRMIRDTAESALTQAVEQARAEGGSWASVGRALDVTRQAAHAGYSA